LSVPDECDYVTKLCKQQEAVIQNYENANVHRRGKGEASHTRAEHKGLELGGGQA
jgi:hypothetical protein